MTPASADGRISRSPTTTAATTAPRSTPRRGARDIARPAARRSSSPVRSGTTVKVVTAKRIASFHVVVGGVAVILGLLGTGHGGPARGGRARGEHGRGEGESALK